MGQEAGRETIYFYFLHQREDQGGRRGSARQRTCMLPSKTHGPSYFLLSAAAGGGGCFVKQGESELAVCVQRREECFVQGWSIVHQTTRCPPTPQLLLLIAQTGKSRCSNSQRAIFSNNLRCESSSRCRGLR